MDVVEELKKIKKKEQELYKFILQQFLDLEEFKKSFSSSIAKTVDTKLEQIDKILLKHSDIESSSSSDLETIKKVILENLHILKGEQGEKGEKGEQGEKGEKGEQGEKGEKGEQGEKGKQGEQGEQGAQGEQGEKGEQGKQDEKGEKDEKGAKGEQGEQDEKSEDLGLKRGYYYNENGEIPDIAKTLEKYNTCSIFLKSSIIGIFILPKPNDSFIGKELLIINTSSSIWKIRVEEGIKIGGQIEKILNKSGNYLKLVSDGEKYYIL